MTRGGTFRSGQHGGHGATHRGRFFVADRDRSGVRDAMQRLLRLGGADAVVHAPRSAAVPIAFLEAGEGPPVVLLHGGSGGGANWYRVIGGLSRTHRVLAPDLPGFGLSPVLARLPPRASLSSAGAEILLAWLDSLGIASCDVVGTSFGGLLALRLAQLRPEGVRRLVLIDSAGLGRAMPWGARLAALPGLGRALLRPTRHGIEWLFRHLLVAHPDVLPAEDSSAILAYLEASAASADPGWAARVVAAFGGLRGQREVLRPAELARISQPLLLLWGARDAFLPLAHGRRAARAAPRALLRVLPGVGHSPNWEVPGEVNAALAGFLGPTRRPLVGTIPAPLR